MKGSLVLRGALVLTVAAALCAMPLAAQKVGPSPQYNDESVISNPPAAGDHTFGFMDLRNANAPIPIVVPIAQGPPFQAGYPTGFGSGNGNGTCDVNWITGGSLNERNFGGFDFITGGGGDLVVTVDAVGLVPFTGADCGPGVGDVMGILYTGPAGHNPATPCTNWLETSFDGLFPDNFNTGESWTYTSVTAAGDYTFVLQNICDTFPPQSSGDIDITFDFQGAVPTMGEWAMLSLAVLLLLGGLAFLRLRQRTV